MIRNNIGELPLPFVVKYTCDDITLTAQLEHVRAAIDPDKGAYLKNVRFNFTAPNKASNVKIELEKGSDDFVDLKGHLKWRGMAQ